MHQPNILAQWKKVLIYIEFFRANKKMNGSVICLRSISVSYTILDIFMGKKKSVSSFMRAEVVALHDAGFNQVQISIQLNSSRCYM